MIKLIRTDEAHFMILSVLGPSYGTKNYSETQEGTKTAFRGKKAHQSISREIVELCEVIEMNSKVSSPDGRFKGILFGDLFNIYNSISNKVR